MAGLFATLFILHCSLPAGSPGDSEKDLKETIRSGNAAQMLKLIQGLSKSDDPRSAELLVEGAISIPSLKNYEAAKKAIARFSNQETIESLVKTCYKARDFRKRILILDAFGLRKDEKSRQAIHDTLKAKKEMVQVRIAAIHACVNRKEKEAIPLLIDLVDSYQGKRGRTLLESREALLLLTGRDFDAVEDWRKFWDGNKKTLDPANLDRKGLTRIVLKKTRDSVEFFGKEILSRNVMFVIDCSQSMMLWDPDPEFRGDDIEVRRERLRRAKLQLLLAVRKLPPGSRYNIIAFNDHVYPWSKTLVPASRSSFNKARKFVAKFKADLLTHTDKALELAFTDPNIDTIVLLSDGSPYKGVIDPDLPKKILERVRDLNSSRKIRIDTFGFEGAGKLPRKYRQMGYRSGGTSEELVKFLKALASQNSGEYQSIR